MPVLLDPKRTLDYTPLAFRDSDAAPVFQLRTLTLRERAEVQDARFGLDGEKPVLRTAQARVLAFHLGLVGWRNVAGPAGPVMFPAAQNGGPARITDALADMIPLDLALEIGEEILRLSRLTEDERGN